MRKVDNRKKEKKRMSFLLATNVIASRPPERQPTGTPHARAKITFWSDPFPLEFRACSYVFGAWRMRADCQLIEHPTFCIFVPPPLMINHTLCTQVQIVLPPWLPGLSS